MDIKTLQEDFVSAIFGGDSSPATSHVMGDDVLTAEQRFGIYTGSVHGILTQALGATFPVCKSLVGDQFFDNMSKIFIDKHPPTTSFFAEYGDKFPEFLTTFEHVKDIFKTYNFIFMKDDLSTKDLVYFHDLLEEFYTNCK